jgi:starvation-inducible DNA-binding protein
MSNAALQATPSDFSPDTGIAEAANLAVAESLRLALADTFMLYLKTLGVHWNIVGPGFFGLHKLTEEQYEDLAKAADAVAERIRALGHIAPAAFGDYARLSCVKSETTIATAADMIRTTASRRGQDRRRGRRHVHRRLSDGAPGAAREKRVDAQGHHRRMNAEHGQAAHEASRGRSTPPNMMQAPVSQDYHLDNDGAPGSYAGMSSKSKTTKAGSRSSSQTKPVWADGLRRMYNEVVDEKIPDEFVELLKQLDEPRDGQ